MGGRGVVLIFAVVVLAAVAAIGLLVLAPQGAEPAAKPPVAVPPGPGQPPADPGPSGKKSSDRKGKTRREPAAPVPPEPGFAASRDACLSFLRTHAGPPVPVPGKVVTLLPQVRQAAMEALLAIDPAAAEPLITAALAGDGNATDWSDERLFAAALRIRDGKPDGAATLQAFLKEEDFAFGGTGPAALAAAALPPAEGAPVLKRLLAQDRSDYDEDVLVAILHAATTLGAGADTEDLKGMLVAEAGTWNEEILGAAAGALLRMGDPAGRRLAEKAATTDAHFDLEGLAKGLGARGNKAAVPWLTDLMKTDDFLARTAAARSLGVVGDASAIPALAAALKDEQDWVRHEAAVSLVLLGSPDGLPGARAATAAKDPELQELAWKALAQAKDAPSKAAAGTLLASPMPGVGDVHRSNALLVRIAAARAWLASE